MMMASLYAESRDYAASEIRDKGEAARRYWRDTCEWTLADLAYRPAGTGILGRDRRPDLRAKYIVKLIAWRRALAEA
jgi:hypothetical protein